MWAFSAIPNGAAFPASGVLSGQRAVVSCDDGYEVLGDASLLCDRGEYQFMTSFLRADFVRAVVRGERNVTTADPPAVWRYGGDSMQRRL